MPTSDAPTSPGFWRCVKCGTPNPGSLYIRGCIACGFPRPAPGFESGMGGATAPAGTHHRGSPRAPRLLIAVAAYGMVLLAAFLLEKGIGDAWWPGYALSLSPRVGFLLPLIPLGVVTWRKKRPWIGVTLACEALFVAGPLMGFVVPWGRLSTAPSGATVRIMTFNAGGLAGFDVPGFLDYLTRKKVDVVCFQEVVAADRMLTQGLAERGWHRDGSALIATRLPIVADLAESTQRNVTHKGHVHYTARLFRAKLRGPDGREFVVGSLHMPTPRPALRGLLRLDPSDLGPFAEWWNSELLRMFEVADDQGDIPTLVAGDFNAGPGATNLAALRESGMYQSAFDQAGLGWGYTRPSAFPFARIDHILASPAWWVRSCWVGPSFGSDHRSMVADVTLPSQP